MLESTLPIQWTDQQWGQVLQVVQDEANKARVCAQFLPLFGPLSPDTTTVPAQRLKELGGHLSIDDFATLPLVTLAVHVELSKPQVSQPELSTALTMFRRAANMIARAEDTLIFGGMTVLGKLLPLKPPPPDILVSGGGLIDGLVAVGKSTLGGATLPVPGTAPAAVSMVSSAIGMLESTGHVGPYALLLGNDLFNLFQDPTGSLVLPSDRTKPFLNGPLLRSGVLGPNNAVLISTSGDPVEIVVASDIGVRFLQLTTADSPRYVFRVSERVVLRVKDSGAVLAI